MLNLFITIAKIGKKDDHRTATFVMYSLEKRRKQNFGKRVELNEGIKM